MLRSRRLGSLLLAGAAVLGLFAACGDDDGESAQASYCDAVDALRTSVSSLTDLDVVAEGTSGLRTAVDEVKNNLEAVREAGSEAADSEITALQDAVDNLESELSSLSGDLTLDNASAVVSAIGETATAAGDVYATLSDCP